jgi:hypothetical protein
MASESESKRKKTQTFSFFSSLINSSSFSAMTDEFGLVGGVAQSANRVPYILSAPESLASTIQISSTWNDDLKKG